MKYRFAGQARTLAVDDIDHVEWRKGRERFAVWLVDADIAPVRRRVAAARRWLAGFLSPSRRQPHVTVAVAGFLSDLARGADDYSHDRHADLAGRLSSSGVPSFVLKIGGIDSFESAAFLRVEDPEGGLSMLRSTLGLEGGEPSEPYVPHVTIGTYRGAFPVADVASRLDRFGDGDPIALPVSRISLAAYDARHIGGPLEYVENHPLRLAPEEPPGDRRYPPVPL